MRRFLVVFVVVLAFVLAGGFSEAKERVWQKGTVTDIDIVQTGVSVTFGSGGSHAEYRCSIETGERMYVAEKSPGFRPLGFPKLEVNSPVTFAVEKQWLYVLDLKGKVHRLYIIKQGPKATADRK